jgi:hypothetical protein
MLDLLICLATCIIFFGSFHENALYIMNISNCLLFFLNLYSDFSHCVFFFYWFWLRSSKYLQKQSAGGKHLKKEKAKLSYENQNNYGVQEVGYPGPKATVCCFLSSSWASWFVLCQSMRNNLLLSRWSADGSILKRCVFPH